MVKADLQRASGSVAEAFRERDIKTLALTGGVATFGFIAAVSVGSIINNTLGISGSSRAGAATVAVGAVLSALAGLHFLGPAVGGAMSIGALVALGSGVVLTALGPTQDNTVMGMVESADVADSVPSITASGTCGSCGGSTPQKPTVRRSSAAPQPSHGGYR